MVPGSVCRVYGQSCEEMDLELKQHKKNSWWFTKTVMTGKKNPKNTKLTFLFDYSSDPTENTTDLSEGGDQEDCEGAAELRVVMCIYLKVQR